MIAYGLVCLFCLIAQLPYPWTWTNIIGRVILGFFVVSEAIFDAILIIGWIWEIWLGIKHLFKKGK